MDGDPSIEATVSASDDFDVVEREKGRFAIPDGWSSSTAYLLAVDGILSVETASSSLELPMDGCFAFAETGMSQSH